MEIRYSSLGITVLNTVVSVLGLVWPSLVLLASKCSRLDPYKVLFNFCLKKNQLSISYFKIIFQTKIAL